MVSPGVDLYNTAYGNYERDLYREVRLETYGEDFGQTSWVTTEESHEIPRLPGAHFCLLSFRGWLRFGRLRIAPSRDLPLQHCWLGPERRRDPKCERSGGAEEAGRALPVPRV